MTLQQLRYIVAIDDHRHFGKAAEACGLTQSTLSLMVKKLEERPSDARSSTGRRWSFSMWTSWPR